MTGNEFFENFCKYEYLQIDNDKSKLRSKKLTAYHIEHLLLVSYPKKKKKKLKIKIYKTALSNFVLYACEFLISHPKGRIKNEGKREQLLREDILT
jgi:hypothetical protein